jgi:hypothetical protein
LAFLVLLSTEINLHSRISLSSRGSLSSWDRIELRGFVCSAELRSFSIPVSGESLRDECFCGCESLFITQYRHENGFWNRLIDLFPGHSMHLGHETFQEDFITE